jgi:hypothetical protein
VNLELKLDLILWLLIHMCPLTCACSACRKLLQSDFITQQRLAAMGNRPTNIVMDPNTRDIFLALTRSNVVIMLASGSSQAVYLVAGSRFGMPGKSLNGTNINTSLLKCPTGLAFQRLQVCSRRLSNKGVSSEKALVGFRAAIGDLGAVDCPSLRLCLSGTRTVV